MLAAGDRRITYFLADARAVELVFGPDMQGLECISVSRLGIAIPENYFIKQTESD